MVVFTLIKHTHNQRGNMSFVCDMTNLKFVEELNLLRKLFCTSLKRGKETRALTNKNSLKHQKNAILLFNLCFIQPYNLSDRLPPTTHHDTQVGVQISVCHYHTIPTWQSHPYKDLLQQSQFRTFKTCLDQALLNLNQLLRSM